MSSQYLHCANFLPVPQPFPLHSNPIPLGYPSIHVSPSIHSPVSGSHLSLLHRHANPCVRVDKYFYIAIFTNVHRITIRTSVTRTTYVYVTLNCQTTFIPASLVPQSNRVITKDDHMLSTNQCFLYIEVE